jgi:hypothetical protein
MGEKVLIITAPARPTSVTQTVLMSSASNVVQPDPVAVPDDPQLRAAQAAGVLHISQAHDGHWHESMALHEATRPIDPPLTTISAADVATDVATNMLLQVEALYAGADEDTRYLARELASNVEYHYLRATRTILVAYPVPTAAIETLTRELTRVMIADIQFLLPILKVDLPSFEIQQSEYTSTHFAAIHSLSQTDDDDSIATAALHQLTDGLARVVAHETTRREAVAAHNEQQRDLGAKWNKRSRTVAVLGAPGMGYGENVLPYLRRSVEGMALHATSRELRGACRGRLRWPHDVCHDESGLQICCDHEIMRVKQYCTCSCAGTGDPGRVYLFPRSRPLSRLELDLRRAASADVRLGHVACGGISSV